MVRIALIFLAAMLMLYVLDTAWHCWVIAGVMMVLVVYGLWQEGQDKKKRQRKARDHEHDPSRYANVGCPECRQRNAGQSQYCRHCGSHLHGRLKPAVQQYRVQQCIKCYTTLPAGSSYCSHCGSRLG